MENKISVSVELTTEQAAAAQTLLDDLININAFTTLSYDSFLLLERFTVAVNTELEKKLRMMANKTIPEDVKCQTCSHIRRWHSDMAEMVCCKESCNCMNFIKSQ